MSSPYREVYSRCLLGADGYPLWNPQLNTELCNTGRYPDGLEIGDVGILSPKNGSFNVLFNIARSRQTQPYPELVGEDFAWVELGPSDLDTQPNAVIPSQCVFTHGSIQLSSAQVHCRNQVLPRATYEFNLSVEDGAVLILPEGAESCDLTNERAFLDKAIQFGTDWFTCATQKAGRLIRNDDSLYLITGYHKASSWSLGATYGSTSSLHGTRSLQFEIGGIKQGSVTAQAYNWTPVHGFLGHAGPLPPSEQPGRSRVNQTVFIRGFRITVNNLLFLKTVSVKTQEGAMFGGLKDYVKNLIWGRPSSASTQSSGAEGPMDNMVEQDFSRRYTDAHMTIDDVPDIPQIFHPGDLINRHMLKKEPHAKVAITHDSLWNEMLQKALLELTDFSREECLEKVLSENYQMIVEEDAVYLGRICGSPPYEHSELASWSSMEIGTNLHVSVDSSVDMSAHSLNEPRVSSVLSPDEFRSRRSISAAFPVHPSRHLLGTNYSPATISRPQLHHTLSGSSSMVSHSHLHDQSVTNTSRRPAPAFSLPVESASPKEMVTSVCRWTRDDGTICSEEITNESVPQHLVSHHIGNRARNNRLSCNWQGCRMRMNRMTMNRGSIVRHVREKHLNSKRHHRSGQGVFMERADEMIGSTSTSGPYTGTLSLGTPNFALPAYLEGPREMNSYWEPENVQEVNSYSELHGSSHFLLQDR